MTDTPFKIAFLIYPGMTQLDFTGPAEVVSRMPDAEMTIVAKTKDPVRADNGIIFQPHADITDETLYSMICVPGGFACTEVMLDEDCLAWLRRQGAQAEYVTSVCTGSLILAAAGLLDGYKAGCHWAWADHLKNFGATPTRERVVVDRNRITAGGVTAGIDFGFRIVAERFGKDFAEALVLGLEYDPAPISGGTPETARVEIIDLMRQNMAALNTGRDAELAQAAANYS